LTGTNIASSVKKINKVLFIFQLVLATDKAQISNLSMYQKTLVFVELFERFV